MIPVEKYLQQKTVLLIYIYILHIYYTIILLFIIGLKLYFSIFLQLPWQKRNRKGSGKLKKKTDRNASNCSGDGVEDDDREKPHWQYFDSILFLKDQCLP